MQTIQLNIRPVFFDILSIALSSLEASNATVPHRLELKQVVLDLFGSDMKLANEYPIVDRPKAARFFEIVLDWAYALFKANDKPTSGMLIVGLNLINKELATELHEKEKKSERYASEKMPRGVGSGAG